MKDDEVKIHRGVPVAPREVEVKAMKKCDLADVLICAASFQKHVYWAGGVALCFAQRRPTLADRLRNRDTFTELCWADMPKFQPLVEIPHAQQSFPVCNADNMPGVRKLVRWLKGQERL